MFDARPLDLGGLLVFLGLQIELVPGVLPGIQRLFYALQIGGGGFLETPGLLQVRRQLLEMRFELLQLRRCLCQFHCRAAPSWATGLGKILVLAIPDLARMRQRLLEPGNLALHRVVAALGGVECLGCFAWRSRERSMPAS